MALNILHFQHQGRAQWGVVQEHKITPVPGTFATTADFIRANPLAALTGLNGATIEDRKSVV